MWPQSVKDYVQRTFDPDREIPGIQKHELERKLKEVITQAAEGNYMLKTNWDTYPLPQELIYNERLQQTQIFTPEAMPLYNHVAAYHHTNPMESSPPSSKKRKMENGSSMSSESVTPPWRKKNGKEPSGFENRITYANKDQADRMEKRLKKTQMSPGVSSSKLKEDLERRRRRFDQDKPSKYSPRRSPEYDEDEQSRVNTGPVVGTNTKLEKNYFRLTSPPKPEDVRPQYILEQTLELLTEKWKANANYNYICDQFKSMRQDLTVQHIKNAFTVKVYEQHAHIALEKGDLGEYNQCQTQLRALYSLKLGGHPEIFLAYRILYFILTANLTGLNSMLAELTPTDKQDPAVKHALEMRSAIASGNYHRFFRLTLDVPNLGAYLVDKFIERERLIALSKISTAYVVLSLERS
jgi:SAC3 family protein LENG8/THP3